MHRRKKLKEGGGSRKQLPLPYLKQEQEESLMEIKEFAQQVADAVQERLDGECRAEIKEIRKNNNAVLTGLMIRNPSTNVSPCIYLEEFFQGFEKGTETVEGMADRIAGAYREAGLPDRMDISFFTDYEKARKKVRGKLVNTEMNRKLLEAVPHREFLDLSMVYMLRLEEEEECGMECSIDVKNEYLELWNVSEEELFRDADANARRDGGTVLKSIVDIIKETPYGEEMAIQALDKSFPMYVMTNRRRTYGAVGMLDAETLKEAGKVLGGSYYILPSSVHELILLASSGKEGEVQQLEGMVKEINDTQVLAEERLGYHIYRYDNESGKISVVS